MKEMVVQCIANGLDIFCMGVILGAIAIKSADWSLKMLDVWFGNNQKKLDLELGKAIEEMQNRFLKMDRERAEFNEAKSKLGL